MTTSAYAPLTQAEKIFKDLIWDPVFRLGEGYLEGVAPFFALPIVRTLEEGVINEISDYIFSNLALIIDVTAIRLINAAHQSAYDTASVELAIVAQESGIESDAFKQARDAAKVALSNFTRLPV